MRSGVAPAEQPLNLGDLVHISTPANSDNPPHKHACVIKEIYPDDTLAEYSYTVRCIVEERVLSPRYNHYDLIPSPRGYQNISTLIGDDHVEYEEFLGRIMPSGLELINELLSVVDFEKDPTKDWLNELEKQNIDRLNSVKAEMLLLYHLRKTYTRDKVSLNANIDGEGSKDFDIRVSADEVDVWIEIVKPDYAASIPDDGGFISGDTTGNSIDRKLKQKFETGRRHLPDSTVLVLATYLEEQVAQGLQIGQWLDEEYYDVGEFCDAWLTYTHLVETEIQYTPFTEEGKRCTSAFENIVDN